MAQPVDHLAGKTGYTHELLAALTDTELEEQLAFFQERESYYRTTPDPEPPKSMYRSHNYAAYRYSNKVGMTESERNNRRVHG